MTEDKLKEECGVFGIFSNENINPVKSTYYGLYALQHRGQESAGIVVSNGEYIKSFKSMGLVSNLLNKEEIETCYGKLAIGHVRYSTTGDSSIINAQPLVNESSIGKIALAHNGNIINGHILKRKLKNEVRFETTTDTEVILKLIINNINNGITLKDSIKQALKYVVGAYSIVIMTKNKLIAVRDPMGIRPLCLGNIGTNYVICSESCCLNTLGGDLIRDILPGEMIEIDKNGIESSMIFHNTKKCLCSFEYIYFAREDSIIEDRCVFNTRFLLGKKLFNESNNDLGDIVIGVPDSGIPVAMGYAKASNIPYDIGFIKNRYIGRTFISPNEEYRKADTLIKLVPIKENIRGKKVIIVDDSIVRGTVSKTVVKMLREVGAKEIHLRIACPIVKYCCNLGINISKKQELIGNNMNLEEIGKYIGADSIRFLNISGIKEVLGENSFCYGCFDRKYPYTSQKMK